MGSKVIIAFLGETCFFTVYMIRKALNLASWATGIGNSKLTVAVNGSVCGWTCSASSYNYCSSSSFCPSHQVYLASVPQPGTSRTVPCSRILPIIPDPPVRLWVPVKLLFQNNGNSLAASMVPNLPGVRVSWQGRGKLQSPWATTLNLGARQAAPVFQPIRGQEWGYVIYMFFALNCWYKLQVPGKSCGKWQKNQKPDDVPLATFCLHEQFHLLEIIAFTWQLRDYCSLPAA